MSLFPIFSCLPAASDVWVPSQWPIEQVKESWQRTGLRHSMLGQSGPLNQTGCRGSEVEFEPATQVQFDP